MSFNRRGPNRPNDRPNRPDRDRGDRPNRPPGGRDWQPPDRAGGERGGQRGDRPYAPRPGGDRPYSPRPGGDRPYAPRPGGDRPYAPRPRFDGPQDEGAMSIRLDPRRVGVLKQLAADANTRPGDLVRIWIEERLDAEKRGGTAPGGLDVAARLAELSDRVAALESAGGTAGGTPAEATTDAASAASPAAGGTAEQSSNGDAPMRRARNRVAAAPSGERVALHDEIISVVTERGPLPATEIATAIVERGRYRPPRSGKPLDAATVNARVSNPTYRGRFTRSGGRIGLVEG